MFVFLVHHGDAVGPHVDPQRPLSSRGVESCARLAAAVGARGARPAAVWHSGKLRARQTAEHFWRACNPLAEFSALRGLQPDDPPEWVRDVLSAETRDVLLAGHWPNLPRLFQLLDADGARAAQFPQHGVVALQRGADGTFREAWRLDEFAAA